MNPKRLCTVIVLAVFCMFCGDRASAYPGKIKESYSAPGGFSTGMTFDGKRFWVADYKKDTLFALTFDGGKQKVVHKIPSPGFWPMGLAWDGTHLWNVDAEQKKIFKLDPSDGTILGVIQAPASKPGGLTWFDNALWLSDQKRNKILKLDVSDGTAVKTLPGPAQSIQGLTYDGTYLWCSDRLQDEIYMVSPDAGAVVMICPAPGSYASGLAWDGACLWNVDYQSDRIYQLVHRDGETRRLTNRREAVITVTHEVAVSGQGWLKELTTYFALPRDLPQQTIRSIDFVPERYAQKTDKWNQAVACFTYKEKPAGSIIRTVMKVTAEIAEIDYFIVPERCGTLSDIPEEIRRVYTQDGSKYQVNDPFIRKTVKEVVGGEQNPYWIARKIFDYVRNRLTYKMEGGWNAAPFVLKRRTGSCSEYSFCFIALARAAGLPARYVGAFVMRGDEASLDESFHRWPEIYLPGGYGWITIDPQGGDDPLPRDRARAIGHLSNRFLITTCGAGDSEYLGWYYNCDEKYILEPKVQVHVDAFAEWDTVSHRK